MTTRPRIVILAASLVVFGCVGTPRPDPTPSPVPPGTSPREAVLGRPATDTDCFTTAFDLVQVPDGLTLERHIRTAARRPAWLPSRGFLGSPAELARAVNGLLIANDPQTTWVLVPDGTRPHADRYFPLVARTGERVWYRDGSVQACL